jgi:hypothetical protein
MLTKNINIETQYVMSEIQDQSAISFEAQKYD